MVNTWQELLQEKDVPKTTVSLPVELQVFLQCEGTKALIWEKVSWKTAKAKLDKKRKFFLRTPGLGNHQNPSQPSAPPPPPPPQEQQLSKPDLSLAQIMHISTV